MFLSYSSLTQRSDHSPPDDQASKNALTHHWHSDCLPTMKDPARIRNLKRRIAVASSDIVEICGVYSVTASSICRQIPERCMILLGRADECHCGHLHPSAATSAFLREMDNMEALRKCSKWASAWCNAQRPTELDHP